MAGAGLWLEKVRAGEPFQMMDWDFIAAVQAAEAKVWPSTSRPTLLHERECWPGFSVQWGRT
jgi:hypothetical protein